MINKVLWTKGSLANKVTSLVNEVVYIINKVVNFGKVVTLTHKLVWFDNKVISYAKRVESIIEKGKVRFFQKINLLERVSLFKKVVNSLKK